MIVCVCHVLCERQCREVAARVETRGPGCIYRQLGCRVRCGACVATMREIVEHVQAERAAHAREPEALIED